MFSILLGFEKKHLNAIELTSCVMHVFSGLMTMCLKASGNFSLPWKHYETYLAVVLGMFLIGLPLSFHYVLGFHIFIIHFSKLSLMTGTIQSLNLIDTCIISFSKCLYILFTLILSLELNSQIEFSLLLLLIVLLQNQENQHKILTQNYLNHQLLNCFLLLVVPVLS